MLHESCQVTALQKGTMLNQYIILSLVWFTNRYVFCLWFYHKHINTIYMSMVLLKEHLPLVCFLFSKVSCHCSHAIATIPLNLCWEMKYMQENCALSSFHEAIKKLGSRICWHWYLYWIFLSPNFYTTFQFDQELAIFEGI